MKKIVLAFLTGILSCFCYAQSSVKSGMAEVSEKVLYYEESGQGPVVVLIHGGQLDRRMWDEQFELLAKSYRVIRYDVRGYGKSRIPANPYSDVEDLFGLLRSLRVERAHLIGLSLGGRIAIDFALTHPGMVSTLICAAPGLSGFQWSADSYQSFTAILHAAQSGDEAKASELWLKDPYMAPAMENPALAEKIRRISRENLQIWLVNPLLQIDIEPPAIDRLAEIKAPVLLLVGDRDVPDIRKIVDLLDEKIPDSKKVLIPGSGHMINMEKPSEFNKYVDDFLSGH